MPVYAQERKYLSSLISGPITDYALVADYHYAVVTVEALSGGGDVTISPLGSPLIYSDANDVYIPFVAQDPTAVTEGGTPDEAPVVLTVGMPSALGKNDADIVIAEGETAEVLAVFRGPLSIKQDGIEWSGSSSAGNKAAFVLQLQKQGISNVPSATDADPSFIV